MSFLGFLLLGLICGAIAKAILSDRAPGGWLGSLIVGVIGALIGGWLGSAIFKTGLSGFFSLSSWLLAIGGSLIVLVVYGALTKKRA